MTDDANENYVPPEDRNKRSLRDVVIEDRWRLGGLAGLGLILTAYFGFDVTVPRWLHTLGLSFGLTVLIAYAPGSRIVRYLFTPPYNYLIDDDARDNEYAVWRLPPAYWRDLKIEGELYPLRAMEPTWAGRNYDPEANTVEGDFRGEMSDQELLEHRTKVDELRKQYAPAQQKYDMLRLKFESGVRTSVSKILGDWIAAFESATMFRGDRVQETIEEVVPDPEPEEAKEKEEPGDDGSEAEPNVDGLDDADAVQAATDGGR